MHIFVPPGPRYNKIVGQRDKRDVKCYSASFLSLSICTVIMAAQKTIKLKKMIPVP